MGKTNFDELMKRYLTGQVSDQEKSKIEAWLEVMKSEDSDNLELSKEDEEKLFRKIISSRDNVKEIESFVPGKQKISPSGWLLRIAASILIIFMVSYTAWYLNTRQDMFQASSHNKIEKIILNDGTLVWLRGHSNLAYYNKAAEGIRYTELEGEALFEVAKDAEHPFIIQCGDVSLKVVGTSFSVKTGNDSLELKVLTGKVNVSLTNTNVSLDVKPNEKIIYTGNGKLEKMPLDKNEVSQAIADTEYNMEFTNVTLNQALESIQRKFDVTIKLADDRIGNCRITIDLTDRSLDNSLQMIAEVLDVQFHHEGDHGYGCWQRM
jgi:transmembrane sensor